VIASTSVLTASSRGQNITGRRRDKYTSMVAYSPYSASIKKRH